MNGFISSTVLVVLACVGVIAVYGLISRRRPGDVPSTHGPIWPDGHPDHPEVGDEARACRCGRPGTPEEHIAQDGVNGGGSR